ncbi:MAG: class I SAM-dependent methyltransferase [Candidatus Abyssobacteria bacterium SURF_5]|uniref:Class I SAM-dependent methyltransferase n=1 Tax=Abyssobacteria bacterium (strain SURF_5) TaxID=2093360 RepID=A0A3A4N8D6_ABYX5|nr:MAG: class I SAM-dependent methyltransferase [Candidatus Abyssubacteria bacterium SURF_5]
MNKRIYDHPEEYEAAFSFRDIKHEVDVIEKCVELHSRILVRRTLELGCGPAPHSLELMRRGYSYIGVDLNDRMLQYAKAKAKAKGFSPVLVQADMSRFELQDHVDFALVLLGSLYVKNAEEFLSHLSCVANALNPGGLYLLDWCIEFNPLLQRTENWMIQADRYRIEASYLMQNVDPATRTFDEIIRLRIIGENDVQTTLEEVSRRHAIIPDEFVGSVEKSGQFEFIGWWNNWNLDEPLDKHCPQAREGKIERPIALLRRLGTERLSRTTDST